MDAEGLERYWRIYGGQELGLDVAFKRQAVELNRCTIAIRCAIKLDSYKGERRVLLA